MISEAVILIPDNTPTSWTADYVLQTAKILSKNNLVILVTVNEAVSLRQYLIKKFSKKRDFKVIEKKNRIFYLKPIYLIPLRRMAVIEKLNFNLFFYLLKIFLSLKYRNRKKLLWIFSPEFSMLPNMFRPQFKSLYDCVDYFVPVDKIKYKQTREKEKQLIESVDVMTVISNSLYQKHKELRSNIEIVPQGFDEAKFRKVKNTPFPTLTFSTAKPIIGFVGGLDYRLDFDLLFKLIKALSDYSFVFIGPLHNTAEDLYFHSREKINVLLKQKNVNWLKRQTRRKIATFIKQFDICLIPYNVNLEFNKFCYPMKVMEYLYLQKPIISTPIYELLSLKGIVKICSNSKEFAESIKSIQQNGWPRKIQNQQKKFAKTNSWENKLNQISKLIESL